MSNYYRLTFRNLFIALSIVLLAVAGIPDTHHTQAHTDSVSSTMIAQTGDVLWSQVGGTDVAIPSAYTNVSTVYDTQAADDFEVPASGWTITSVQAFGSGGLAGADFDVIFFTDSGGIPGSSEVCTRLLQSNSGTTADPIINLDTPCTLSQGHYWLLVRQWSPTSPAAWYWSNTTNSTVLSPAVWRAPGNTISCTIIWTPLNGALGCSIPSQDPPDRRFELYGHIPLAATASCNGDSLEVTITDGDSPFNITSVADTPHLPMNGVDTGTHVIQGPDEWENVTVTETTGDTESLIVASSYFSCVNLDGSIIIPNGAPATTDGVADPYPDTRFVSGLGTTITDVNVTLTGLGHSYPSDVAVLLVSPSGTAVQIMGDACNNWGGYVYDFTFDDEAAGQLPYQNGCVSGTYQPSVFTAPLFPSPAPAGPYATDLSTFDGEDPNGTWSLYILDIYGYDYGDLGSWSLDITAPTAALAASAACNGPNLDVTISAGDGPFNITAAAGVNTPVNGVGIGTTTINGPEKWDDVAVTEIGGDTEAIPLGQFKCRTDERPAPQWPPHRYRTTNPHPYFSWTAVSFASNYRVFVFDDKVVANRTVDIRENSGGSTNMTLSSTLPDGRFFWRVRGRTNRVWGLWSERFTLFKDPAPISVNTPVPTIELNPPSGDNSAPNPAPTFPAPPNSR